MTEILNVLYVEDNNADALLLDFHMNHQLNGKFLHIDVARNIVRAKGMLTKQKYQAVLIDWNLPDWKGTEMAEHIDQYNPEVPIMFISASDFSEDQKDAVAQYGVVAFVQKDYNNAHIEEIQTLLDNLA